MKIHALYINTVANFIHDTCVHSQIKKNQTKFYSLSKQNNASLHNSIEATRSLLKDVLKINSKVSSSLVAFEVHIINDDSRLNADVAFFGKGFRNQNGIFFLENKEWSGDFLILTDEATIAAGKVQTKYKDSEDDTGKRRHPSLQASDYKWKNQLGIRSEAAAYCFRVEKGSQTYNCLYQNGYNDYIKDCKTYTKSTKNNLAKYLANFLSNGSGMEVYEELI